MRLRRVTYLAILVVVVALPVASLMVASHKAYGATMKLTNRFDQLSNSTASATATNLIGFTINETSMPLGSIEFQFCSNDPLPDYPCTAPTGLDASGAVLSNQSGNTGFSLASATANEVIINRVPADPFPSGVPNIYQLDNIVNPSVVDTYYLRLYIFQTTDASGPETESGGVAIATTSGLSISTEVPPYLGFCSGVTITGHDCSTASGYYVNLGNFSPAHSSTATSKFVVATNAQNGYGVTVSGTTLTSGNNVIPALATPTRSSSGINQFGINLRANTDPPSGDDPLGSDGAGVPTANYNSPDLFTFNNGDTIASSSTVSDYQTFTVTYLANISSSDPVGVYAATLTYICLANF